MEELTTLYIDKESHKFSAAHYTIFSATERERLHGHNYSVSAKIVAPMGYNGFSADYNVYKNRLAALCDELDEYTLLAGESPYQEVVESGACYCVRYDGQEILFLQSDTKVLPIATPLWRNFLAICWANYSTKVPAMICARLNFASPLGPGRRAVLIGTATNRAGMISR